MLKVSWAVCEENVLLASGTHVASGIDPYADALMVAEAIERALAARSRVREAMVQQELSAIRNTIGGWD